MRRLKRERDKGFIALHIRGGEFIHAYTETLEFSKDYIFYYEIAYEIARRKLEEGYFVILFSQDLSTTLTLRDKLRSDLNTNSIEVAENIGKGYDIQWQSFFDINLLSYAKEIYATGTSGFTRFAQLICGKEITTPYSKVLNTQEQYEIIKKYIDYLNLPDAYKAASLYYLYTLSRELGLNAESKSYIKRALELYPQNAGFFNALNDCYFREEKPQIVESKLKEAAKQGRLLHIAQNFHSAAPWEMWKYEKFHTQYFKNAKQDYPHICFIAAHLYLYVRKDSAHALEMLNKINLDSKEFYALKASALESLLNSQAQQAINVESQINAAFLEPSACERVKSHLAYKLGRAAIDNTKSLLGWIRILYVLSYIKESHKAIPHTKKLESLPDFKKALKIKESLVYKIGEVLKESSKIPLLFKGVWLWKNIKKVQKEHKGGVK